MQFIILGMHRSGTSVLARLLNMMGAYFGPEGISTGANEENPKGFWERRDVRKLNDFVLHSVDCDWDRVADFDLESLPDDVVSEFRNKASTIVREMDAHRPWLIKEPRLCLLLKLWKEQFEVPICIHIDRNPLEVAQSLYKRNNIPVFTGIALWEKYNQSALEASEGLPRVVVSHSRLIHEPEVEVKYLYEQLLGLGAYGLRVPSKKELKSFINKDYYRNRSDESELSQYLSGHQIRIFKEFSNGQILNQSNYVVSEVSILILRAYEHNKRSEQVAKEALEKASGEADALKKQYAQEAKVAKEALEKASGEADALKKQYAQEAKVAKEALEKASSEADALKKQHAQREEWLNQKIKQQALEAKNASEEISRIQAELRDQHARQVEEVSDLSKAISTIEGEVSKIELQRLELEKELAAEANELQKKERTIESLELRSLAIDKVKNDAVKLSESRLQEIQQLTRWLHIIEFHLDSWRWRSGRYAIGFLAKMVGKKGGVVNSDDIYNVLADFRNLAYSKGSIDIEALSMSASGKSESKNRDRHYKLMQSSGLFDANWYLTEYPEVKETGLDPLEHFAKLGLKEKRSPGPDFDTEWYLQNYPDVAQSGVNPLEHYILFGRKELRLPKRFLMLDAPIDFGQEIDIVVTVFNALPAVKKCLRSIKNRRDGFIVNTIVVNDGSKKQTTIWLRTFCERNDSFHLIEHGKNKGYTKAANSGLEASNAPYVIILNSDTIVTNGWLKGLIRCINSDSRMGIVGPLSSAASWQNVPDLYDETGSFAVNDLPDNMTPDDMAKVVASASTQMYPELPFVNGFCFMIRREVIDIIGVMDEESFPIGYGEENDYCIRAADAGFRLAIADDSYVFHAKSQSFGHEQRKALSEQGSNAIKHKHTEAKFKRLVEQVRHTELLDKVRSRIKMELRAYGSRENSVNIASLKILFLLPVKDGGGGAHSVVQEVTEMRRLGAMANIAVKENYQPELLRTYQDIENIDDVFVAYTSEDLLLISKSYNIVVGTVFNSMTQVKQIVDLNPHILPAYYVQDYEPHFYPVGSENWHSARESYTLVPNTVLFAKTNWIANMVEQEHSVKVQKVSPSIDHQVFEPGPEKKDGHVHIAAMIRPKTPRRGAERTMRLLSRIAKMFQDQVTFNLFGCHEDDPSFQILLRDFTYHNNGVLTRPEVASLLAKSDVFIDLSDYQAFGRTALEAMACGCTAMVPKHGGTDEYATDEVNALVVDSFDEEACVARLAALITDNNKLRDMQVEGLLTAASYSVSKAAKSELALFGRELFEHRERGSKTGAKTLDSFVSRVTSSLSVTPVEKKVGKLPITALVITWDVGHNPVGRSYMLAEVLDRVVGNVVIIGFQFPRYGNDTWEPLRNSKIPIISLPGSNFPEFLQSLDKIADRIAPDVIFSCKARLPSVQLGALIKERVGCPLFIDIDDHELTFFKNSAEVSVEDLEKMNFGSAKSDIEPFEKMWTGLAQYSRRFADGILVSNAVLQSEFGGTIVPHVRDEKHFDPQLFDRRLTRQEFGIAEDARVVLFFGTPRLHKGIDLIARSVAKLDDERTLLVVVGNAPDKRDLAKLKELAGHRIKFVQNQPFEYIPQIVSMADAICLPQDLSHPISRFQLPAKAIDAIAMSIPLLVTSTGPLKRLIDLGVAIEVSPETIVAELGHVLKRHESKQIDSETVRTVFLEYFSYAAAANSLRELIEDKLKNKSPTTEFHKEFSRYAQAQKRVLGIPSVIKRTNLSAGKDFVLFWKQNDTCLYGRRVDMIIKYLASRHDVRKVVVFDAPISEFDLLRLRDSTGTATQNRWIYVKTYEKALGKLDSQKISYNVFVHPPGIYSPPGKEIAGTVPLATGYMPYISKVLKREGVISTDAVFWFYPKNFLAAQIANQFEPDKIVVDVVDDHREWPGISEDEKARLTENYRDMLSRADMAMVNCKPMLDKMKVFFADTRLVPNGCDSNPPTIRPMHSKEFEELTMWEGKTIGFVGNLEAKIDIELIEKIALTFNDCRIVLLGSTHTSNKTLKLLRFPNIRMPGVVPYEQIGAWIKLFDVGIIPHHVSKMTENMNPLKVLVYLQWGLPIVTTNVENIEYNGPLLQIAATHESFLNCVDRFLRAVPVDEKEHQAFINHNDWRARFEKHIDELLIHK